MGTLDYSLLCIYRSTYLQHFASVILFREALYMKGLRHSKQFLTAFGLTVGLLAASTPVYAATTGSDVFRGQVPAVNSISKVDINGGGNDLTNMHQSAQTNVAVTKYVLNNNNPSGFTVTLSSTNAGKMIRSGAGGDASKAGNNITYTVTTTAVAADNPPATSFLGCDEPTQLLDASLSTDQTMNFDVNLQKATVDYTYTIKVSTPQKANLFRGTFEDTITMTIGDL